MPGLLTLDAAGGQVLAAVVVDDIVVAERIEPAARGHSAMLAPIVADALAAAGLSATDLDGVAVIVGPGSFTGLRASLAVAHGIGLAAARPLIAVTLAEAMAEAPIALDGRLLWTAIDSRRGRVFLHDGTPFRAVRLDDLPWPRVKVAVAGDAAVAVAAALRDRGGDVMLTEARLPRARDIARAAARRLAGHLPPLAPLPLYVDPPEATPPASGNRPAPAGWGER
jgi:tRNA threonylcarbamoyl adenosine modification protein YeaZ